MKLLNFYDLAGEIHLAAVEGEVIVDLTSVSDHDQKMTSVTSLIAAGADAVTEARSLTDGAIASGNVIPFSSIKHAPLIQPERRIFAVGLNYRDHAKENNVPTPTAPTFFSKLTSGAIPHLESIPLPRGSIQVDYEAEFAVMIGRRARRIGPGIGTSHIGGYTICNDVSARDLQMGDPSGQWFRGKNCEGFAPLGPWVVTSDDISDPGSLEISLFLNGRRRQYSNTSNLILDPASLISRLSENLTLERGDVITTGTPAGVGFYCKPQVFLNGRFVRSKDRANRRIAKCCTISRLMGAYRKATDGVRGC